MGTKLRDLPALWLIQARAENVSYDYAAALIDCATKLEAALTAQAAEWRLRADGEWEDDPAAAEAWTACAADLAPERTPERAR